MVMIAFAGGGDRPWPEPRVVVSDLASFNPLPEMWGLRALGGEERFADLDGSTVLYLRERAVFEAPRSEGTIYLAAGKQLVVGRELTEMEISEHLGFHSCLCALEYESSSAAGAHHVAAGVYRLTRAAAVDVGTDGIFRVGFELSEQGQADRVRLRRLVCWSAKDEVLSLARALPGFATLARKAHPEFLDPPPDDRPVQEQEIARRRPSEVVLVMSDEYVAFGPGGGGSTSRLPPRLDAPELLGTARPGLSTLLREFSSGRKLAIDLSDYVPDLDPFSRRLQRQIGVCWRDPLWP